ncbi:MAG: hypothetical protein ABIO70_15110 [Pseudomonadota bacterium]
MRRLAAGAMLLAGCPGPEPAAPAFPGDWLPPEGFWAYSGPERLIVAEDDGVYDAGAYGVYDPGAGAWVAEGGVAHGDALVACAGPWLVVINRMFGDNLQFVDPEDGATVGQYSVGNGANPAAVVFWGQRAFVSLYEADHLAVLRWDTGAQVGAVDLSPWADADGLPEASQLFVHGGLVWVTLQRLSREAAWWESHLEGVLLGIDPEALEVAVEIPLGVNNPTGRWSLVGDLARVAAVGGYFTDASQQQILLDGGLLEADLAAATARPLGLTEQVAGANVYDAVTDGVTAWLSADTGWGDEASYQAWSVDEPALLGTLFSGYTPAWAWEDEEVPADGVWVARRNEYALELRAWPGGELVSSVDTALQPSAIERCRPGR